MIISNYKNIILVSALLMSAAAVASPAISNCNCSKAVTMGECNNEKAKGPSWWGWLTSDKSSQLHFYQLLELLHVDDDKSVSSDVQDKKQIS